MAVTIKDVARGCGLSISTVSKVFNGYPDISEATRRQVLEVAKTIGYKPNAIARALKTNRTYNLGVLFVDDNISGLTHPFFAALLNAFKAEAEAGGYDITFINHNISGMAMTYLEHCRYRNVDGVCMACVDFRSPEVTELAASDIPCVTVDYAFGGRPSVFSDNVGGMKLLVDRAYGLGHRRIAFIHGQRNSTVTEGRINSFYRTAAAHGLTVPEEYVVEARYDDAPLVVEKLRRLLEMENRPTCVFLPDDACSFAVLAALRQAGLKPEQLSIAGYDGILAAQTSFPRLTTIRQDSPAMGREAARLLLSMIEHPAETPVEPVWVPVQLLEGETLTQAPEL